MEEIRCPNCDTVLYYDDTHGDFYENDYHTECCYYHCPRCEKKYRVDLHYKYVNYSIEEEI